MLHKVDVWIDAGQLKENPLLPEVLQILRLVRASWLPGNIRSKVLTGGIFNFLVGYFEDGKFEEDVVLIRVEGEGSSGWMDRAQEKRNRQVNRMSRSRRVLAIGGKQRILRLDMALHKAGCCTPLYAEFENGMVYGYVHGETLDATSIKDDTITKLIAQELCRFHTVQPEGLEPVCNMWRFGDGLMTFIPEGFPEDPEKHKRYIRDVKPKEVLVDEYKGLQKHLEALNSPVVFCHDDLLAANIIYNEEKGQIQFIDIEFAMYNYEHFEIAHHFCQYQGRIQFTDIEFANYTYEHFEIAHHFCQYQGVLEDLDLSRYPDKAYQLKWIKNYLCYKAELNDSDPEKVTDTDIEEFYLTCRRFALLWCLKKAVLLFNCTAGIDIMASLFFVGVWGLVQAKMSKHSFDYLTFGIRKLDEYFARKDEYLAGLTASKIHLQSILL